MQPPPQSALERKIVMGVFLTMMALGALCVLAVFAALAIILSFRLFFSDEYDYRDDPETDAEIAFCRAYEYGLARPDWAITEYAKAIALANADPRHSPDARTPVRLSDSPYGDGLLAATAHSNRGVAHYKTGNIQAALDDFAAAIEIDPRMRMAYENRGLVRMANGDYAAAIADYDKAIWFSAHRRLSAYEYAYLGRATAHALAGNLDAARADYEMAESLGGGAYKFADLDDVAKHYASALGSTSRGGPRGNLCPDS